MTDEQPEDNKYSSKSQRKRERGELRELANRLSALGQEQIDKISDAAIKESVETTRKIKKGSAHKRQIQYTTKLLSKTDSSNIRQLIDTVDARTSVHAQRFQGLEKWRDELMRGNKKVLGEILLKHPDCDRQLLRRLTRNAIKEQTSNTAGPHFRKLFQFLKRLS